MNLHVLQQKLLHGSVAGLARIALAIPVYIILTPLVMRALGPELFGIWSFSTVIVSLMNLTDFGLKNSLVYHVAKHVDHPEEIRRYFSMTMWMYIAISALALAGTALWGQEALWALLKVPERYRAETTFVLWVTVGGFIWRLLSTSYQALLEGHQELSSSQRISLSWLLVYFLSNLGVLVISPTIYGLGIAGLAGNVYLFLAYFFTVRRRFPHLTLGRDRFDMVGLRRMVRFGIGIQVASICIALREPLYKVLIARAYDLTAVAGFDIAFKLCAQLMSVITTPLLGVFGAAALLASRQEDLCNLLRPLVGVTLGMLLPMGLAVASFAQPLLTYWLGSEQEAAGLLLPLMLAGFAVYYATEVLYKTLEGTGKSGYSAFIQTAVLALQLTSFWLLAPQGLSSVAWSLMAGFSIFSISNLIVFRSSFSHVRLFTGLQWVLLILPSAVYVACRWLFPHLVGPVLFAGYLLVHGWALVASGLVDLVLLRDRLRWKQLDPRQPVVLVNGGLK